MQTGRGIASFRTPGGKVYVVTIQPFYGDNFFTFEYSNGLYIPLGQTRAGHAVTAAYGLVLSPDCSRAYVLTLSGYVWPIDIADLRNPQVGAPFLTPGGVALGIRPQGDRILVGGYSGPPLEVNLLSGTVTTLSFLPTARYSPLRYSPKGDFAYVGLTDSAQCLRHHHRHLDQFR